MMYFFLFVVVKRMVLDGSGHHSIPKCEIATTITVLHTAGEISLLFALRAFDTCGRHNIQDDALDLHSIVPNASHYVLNVKNISDD